MNPHATAVATVRVVSKHARDGFVRINEADFDEAKHERFEDKPAAEDEADKAAVENKRPYGRK
jgi:hypothetical protein